ncbi:MAG: glycosyltransferase family 2 protein [Candidatus Brocadiales bacterium]
MFKQKISVLMPAYNEGVHLYENLVETVNVFEKYKREYEIIVINDGSSDNTHEEALRAEEEFPRIKFVHLGENVGKGRALQEGFAVATGDYAVFLDSDLDLHPSQLWDLFKEMRNRKADVIIGSKRHRLSNIHYPFARKVISHVYAAVLGILFGLPLTDTQAGLKIFRCEVLANVLPRILCKRYAFDVEILANAHHMGYRIVEYPVVVSWRRRTTWERIGLRDMYQTGVDTLAIFYRMHILRYYDRVEVSAVNRHDSLKLTDKANKT